MYLNQFLKLTVNHDGTVMEQSLEEKVFLPVKSTD